MKIRNGYVSNSSSSSYIIGVAQIKKEFVDKVKEFIETSKYIFEIVDGNDDFVYSDAFNDIDCAGLYVPKGDKALKFYDAKDCPCNDDGEIIKEPELHDFNGKIIQMFEDKEISNWFNDMEYKIGTGFNG